MLPGMDLGDIPALARHLLSRFAEQAKLRPLTIGNDALAVYAATRWAAGSAESRRSLSSPALLIH